MSDDTPSLSRELHVLRRTWWRVLRLAYRRMSQGVSAIMASSIAFYALVCLGPLMILSAWALQPLLGQGTRTYQWLQYLVDRLAGQTAGAIMQHIDALVTNPGPHAAGVVSIAVLAWAGLRLFEALDLSLTEVWPGHATRGFLMRKLIALAGMIVAGALLVAAIVINAIVPTVVGWLDRLPLAHPSSVLLQPSLRLAVEVIITFVAFFLLFKFIPVQRVPTRVAVVGALFTTVVWKLVSPVFTLIIARAAEHSAIYGGLAGVVMFLTWAFFGARVLLAGAHFAAAYGHVIYQEAPERLDEAFVHSRGPTVYLDADDSAATESDLPPV